MKFSEYLFDQNRRETLTRDHLIVAKTIKRCHRRRTDAREGLVAILIAGAFMGLYVAAQKWTQADVDSRFLSREVGR